MLTVCDTQRTGSGGRVRRAQIKQKSTMTSPHLNKVFYRDCVCVHFRMWVSLTGYMLFSNASFAAKTKRYTYFYTTSHSFFIKMHGSGL